jgi:hypothetical protein
MDLRGGDRSLVACSLYISKSEIHCVRTHNVIGVIAEIRSDLARALAAVTEINSDDVVGWPAWIQTGTLFEISGSLDT